MRNICRGVLLTLWAFFPAAQGFCPGAISQQHLLARGRLFFHPTGTAVPRTQQLERNRGRAKSTVCGAHASLGWAAESLNLAAGYSELKNQVLSDEINAKVTLILQLGLTDTQLALAAVAVLVVLTYCFSTPSPLLGAIDSVFLRALDAGAEKSWGPDDISPKVGRTLGRGTFGTAYEAFVSSEGKAKLSSAGDDSGRVVIKRLTEDGQGEIEAYFNRRIRRIGQPQHFASFLGGSRRAGDMPGSDRLLVWRYEGGRTLEMFMQEPSFPLNLEDYVIFRNRMEEPPGPPGTATLERELPKRTSTMVRVGGTNTLARDPAAAPQAAVAGGSRTLSRGARGSETLSSPASGSVPASKSLFSFIGGGNDDDELRSARVVRKVLQETLGALRAMHAAGVVHRDVKPANILIAETKQGNAARLIDLGAAVDLRNGFNFDPEKGLLDPRYAPPEQYIVPRDAPPPPGGLLTLLGSPFFWAKFTPDRFDTYSVGITLLQMAVPQLRSPATLKTVATQLKDAGGDMEVWRERYGARYEFAMLDRKNGAGWDLVTKLVRPRGGPERLTAAQALGHRYFSGNP